MGRLGEIPSLYQAEYTEGDVVGISTRADLELVKAQKDLQKNIFNLKQASAFARWLKPTLTRLPADPEREYRRQPTWIGSLLTCLRLSDDE